MCALDPRAFDPRCLVLSVSAHLFSAQWAYGPRWALGLRWVYDSRRTDGPRWEPDLRRTYDALLMDGPRRTYDR